MVESINCVLPKDQDCGIEDESEFEVVSKGFDEITHAIIFDGDSEEVVEVLTDEAEIQLGTSAKKAL